MDKRTSKQGWGEYYSGTRLAQNDKHEYTKNIVLEYYSSTDFPVLVLVCWVLAPALPANADIWWSLQNFAHQGRGPTLILETALILKTVAWASWHLKSLVTLLFNCLFRLTLKRTSSVVLLVLCGRHWQVDCAHKGFKASNTESLSVSWHHHDIICYVCIPSSLHWDQACIP